LKESLFDICCNVGGRLFQAASAAYENARWPKFNRVRGCSHRSLLPDRSRNRELMVAVRARSRTFRRRRLGATVSALTVSALELLGAGTFRHRPLRPRTFRRWRCMRRQRQRQRYTAIGLQLTLQVLREISIFLFADDVGGRRHSYH